MLTAYIKLAYRNLLKNRIASIINIFGLSIAIGCSIVIFLSVYSDFTKNAFHKHGEQIFLVEQIRNDNGETRLWGDTPVPLGPALATDFSQVVRAVRIADQGGTVYHAGNKIQESIRFVDDEFLDMFTYPLKYGDTDVLANPGAVILSEKTAFKYYGKDNPIGRTLTISFGDGPRESFVVQGVAQAFPTNDGLGFQMLINYDRYPNRDTESPRSWADLTRATFIQVGKPEDIEVIAGGMDRYTTVQNAVAEEWTVTGFVFENLLDLQWDASNVRGGIVEGIPWAAIMIFSCLAVFLLSLSCLNYINISLSTATRRLKEIGIRKAVGCHKSQLVVQFFTENICLCLLSLVLGVILAHVFFIPVFNNLANLNTTTAFALKRC